MKNNYFKDKIFYALFDYFAQEFNKDKINIIKNVTYDKENRISVYQTPFNSINFSCSSFHKKIIENNNFKDNKISIDQVKNIFNNHNYTKENNTHCLFLNPEDYKVVNPPKDYKIKKIDINFKDEFNKLKTKCSKEDLNEAQVSLSDDYIVGCFYDKNLVAVAS